MNWKKMLIALMTRGQYKSFIKDTYFPEDAQHKIWTNEIVPLLDQSEYWKPRLNAQKKTVLNDFPISTYDDYEPLLIQAQQSLSQPFNGEDLVFWSETSGTAGKRKFFPITRSFQKQFQRTMPPFIYSLTQRFSGFFKEKILYLVAVDANKATPAGIPSGWISNFNYRNLPGFIKKCYALPDEVFANSEVFEQWAPLYALACDLSGIFAVTPMVIDQFYENSISGFMHYFPYLMGEKSLPPYLPKLQVSKKRRRYLQKLAQSELAFSFKNLWPSLELAACWTSGLCHYPAEQLQQRMGQDIHLVDGAYSATEGWFTVPLDNQHLGGILHPSAHIFEFIEEGQVLDKKHLLPSWNLIVGKKYEVFLTTAMGFVRYRLQDIVQCTGYLNKAPRLEFCYKAQLLKLESCSITGQELQKILDREQWAMEPHWYFARNSLGNRVVLVTDDALLISQDRLNNLHQHLIQLSPTYAHSVETGEVIPMTLFQVPKKALLSDTHAQTKPKLISQQVITER